MPLRRDVRAPLLFDATLVDRVVRIRYLHVRGGFVGQVAVKLCETQPLMHMGLMDNLPAFEVSRAARFFFLSACMPLSEHCEHSFPSLLPTISRLKTAKDSQYLQTTSYFEARWVAVLG